MRADGRRVHQSPDGTLLIHNLQAGDEGSYTCSAYRGSQAVSRSTDVRVVPPGKGPTPGTCSFLRAAFVLHGAGRAGSAVWGTLAWVPAHSASSWERHCDKGLNLPEPPSSRVQQVTSPPGRAVVTVEEMVRREASGNNR